MAIVRSWLLRLLLGFAGLLLLAGVGTAWIVYSAVLRDLPDLHRLEDYRPPLTTRVLDRKGRPIGEFYDERRILVPVGQIPRHVVLAFVAGEDQSFFEHQGLDYWSILRAAWVNLRAGGKVRQGGSTITQQVAKSLLLSSERSVGRKLKDMLLAKRIEEHFSKDEILYLYLNQIYLGHGAYGVGQAARSYFGKEVSQLSVSEAAMLAGLPKAPSDYSPVTNPTAAEERRLYVLRRMFEERYIDEKTYHDAVADPPKIVPEPEHLDFADAAYFTEEVRKEVFAKLGGEQVLRGGLTVETTLDLDLQRAAVSALQRGLEALDRRQRGWRGPLRRVQPAEVPATLEELGQKNELAAGPDGRAVLPTDRALLGLVTSVDRGRGVARVAFAPGVEGRVEWPDVEWAAARPPTLAHDLAALLHVGDVARFERRADPAPGPGAPPARATPADPGPPALVLAQLPEVEGALVSLDAASGDVLALVGGYDFARSEFDRATQARRQPGSAFKPFVYGAALEHDFAPSSIVRDEQVELIDPGTGELWKPKNYTDTFLGEVPLREALARSLNNATIRLALGIGIDPVIEYARRVGIRSPLGRNLSLALGSTEVSLLELTRAYGTFASGGRRLAPRFVTRVLDRDGKVLLTDLPLADLSDNEAVASGAARAAEVRPVSTDAADAATDGAAAPAPDQAIPPAEAFLVTYLLRGPIEDPHGTAHRAASLGRPLAGKTGTTNEQKDAWFIGFSPDLLAGVWVGYDERRFLGHKETGGRAALPIWMDYMRVALSGRPSRDFPVPPGVLFARVDPATGTIVDDTIDGAAFEPFLAGHLPERGGEGAGPQASHTEDGADLLRSDAF